MAHARKLVRQAVVQRLLGVTAAGSRVFATRVDPLKKTPLPAISVYTLSEESTPDGTEPRELLRTVNVEIAGWVAHTDAVPVDDAMDALAEQIEVAMDSDRYLAGAAGESVLESTEMQVRAEDGRSDPLVGIVTLTYAVDYRTTPVVGPLDDFLRATATHELADGLPDDTIPAADGPFTVQEIP